MAVRNDRFNDEGGRQFFWHSFEPVASSQHFLDDESIHAIVFRANIQNRFGRRYWIQQGAYVLNVAP